MAEERTQRRLAAILAADVVGYSRLMEADEAGTLMRLNELRSELFDPAIARFGGRIFKTTGDGALAEFPSAVDAVQCAAEVQRALAGRNADGDDAAKIELRIGISLGDVIVEDDDLYGNGVNVAARLEAMAEPGGVCISGNVQEHVRTLPDIGYEDLGAQQVKNIERPVRAYKMLLDGPAETPRPAARPIWRRWPTAAAAAVVLIAGGLALWQPWIERVEPASIAKMAFPLPDKPSVAVMPFDNISGDPEQGYLVDGITEDVITDLARVPGLFVISRNSTFSYKGKAVKAREVAEELGVRYILEGSARRVEDRIRVNARLIDAVAGHHVWADRYERQLKDVFAVQSELTRKVVSELAVTLNANQQERLFRRHTQNLEAYETFLQARKLRAATRDTDERAKKLFERVVELDPEFAGGYAGLAYIHARAVRLGFSKNRKEDAQISLDFAQRAIAIDDEMSWSLLALGNAYVSNREFDKAVETMERAVALHPSDADAYSFLANFLHWSGRGEEAIAAMTTAARLNPHQRFRNMIFLAFSNFTAGRYEKTVELLAPHFERYAPKGDITITWLAAAYAALGDIDNARRVLDAYLDKHRDMTLARFPFGRAYKHKEDSERLLGFLSKAGMPEFPPPKLPEKPSVAVLPFTNMSDDKEQEYFSDGITEDIITDLSKVSGLFVIARTSTNQYKGKSQDIRKIARELGVRYVVEGSVRKATGKVRVTAQLIDAANGSHVWAERYDRDLKDVFAIQDDVTKKIVSNLKVNLVGDEQNRIAQVPTGNAEAYDYYLRGIAKVLPPTPRNLDAAARFFERVVELDPKFAGGYAGLSRVNSFRYITGRAGREALDTAQQFAEKALSIDAKNQLALRSVGLVYSRIGRIDDAVAAGKKAVDSEPGDAGAHGTYAFFLGRAGRPKEGIREAQLARRLSPHSRTYVHALGFNYRVAGQFNDSIRTYEFYRSMGSGRSTAQVLSNIIAAYIQAGHKEKARKAVQDLLALNPKNTVSFLARTEVYKFKEDRDRFLNALRAAGLPEGEPPKPKAPRLSIVVLPFDNLSDDPKQDYFADGITEDLITDLSRIRDAFVIARGTSFTYKGKPVNAQDVAKELNVRYVLEGSVRRSGDQVRVTAQLINGENGAHVWSDRFDRKFKDVFSLQNDVTGRIAATLKIELMEAESRQKRLGVLKDADAWEVALRGATAVIRGGPPGVYARAKPVIVKALEVGPHLALSWIGWATYHYVAGTRGLPGEDSARSKRLHLEAAEKAVAIDPKNPDAQTLLGLAYYVNGQPERGLAGCREAIDINPNFDDAYLCAGMANIALGKPLDAIPLFEKSRRLNPRYRAWRRNMFFGFAYHFARKHDLAIDALRKSIAGNPRFSSPYFLLASANAHSGRLDEARAAVREFLKRDSGNRNTVQKLGKSLAFISPELEYLLEGLRRAGMPESEPAAPRLSIIVLPFDNLSGDPNQDYLADGITEDLITDLSRIREMFVIARGTSFTYKGKAVNPKDVAKALNIRYVLEGSVRRSGDQVRINAQLIDGESGAHVWGHRFDRKVKDVFSLQDEVTSQIAGTLQYEVKQAASDKLRRIPPKNLTAWDLALRGRMMLLTKPRSTENYLQSKALFENALSLDPSLASAWLGLSSIYLRAGTSGMPGISRSQARKRMLEAAEKAATLDPSNSEAQAYLGNAYRLNRQTNRAKAACERAIELNRNNDLAYSCLGRAMTGLGRTSDAIPQFKKALQLDPYYRAAQKNYFLGLAYLIEKQHDAAAAAFQKSISIDQSFATPHQALAASLALRGRIDEAKKELAIFRNKDLGGMTTIARVKARLAVFSPHFGYVLDGLRQAGMPEK